MDIILGLIYNVCIGRDVDVCKWKCANVQILSTDYYSEKKEVFRIILDKRNVFNKNMITVYLESYKVKTKYQRTVVFLQYISSIQGYSTAFFLLQYLKDNSIVYFHQ